MSKYHVTRFFIDENDQIWNILQALVQVMEYFITRRFFNNTKIIQL